MVSFDELCRQLAFYNSGDSANFDVIILTFSLLSYWETSQSMWLSSFAKGVVSSTNLKLVQSALKVIFESQAEDGTWVKGGNAAASIRNICVYSRGFVNISFFQFNCAELFCIFGVHCMRYLVS